MSNAIKLAFIGSLVLNLLLLGVILGLAPRRFEATPPSRQQRIEEALKKLPEPGQSRVRESFTKMRTSMDPLREQLDRARTETLRLLGTEPFDAAAYDREVGEIEALRAEMSKRAGQHLRQTARELSPEERRMLVEVLRRPAPSK
jgi:uncharacterized membrane protein